jgi:hypothetical protein
MAIPTTNIKMSDIMSEFQTMSGSLQSASRLYDSINPSRVGYGSPDAMSEFSGYSYSAPQTTGNLSGGFAITTTNNPGGTMTLLVNNGVNSVSYSAYNASTNQQISMTQLSSGYTVSTSNQNYIRLTRDDLTFEDAEFSLYLTAASGYEFSSISISDYNLDITNQTTNSSNISIVAAGTTSEYVNNSTLTVYFNYNKIATWTESDLEYALCVWGYDSTQQTAAAALLVAGGGTLGSFRYNANGVASTFLNATELEYDYPSTGWGSASCGWFYDGTNLRFWDGSSF